MNEHVAAIASARPMATLGELVESVSSWNPSARASSQSFTYIDLSAIDQEAKRIIGAREIPCGDAPSRARQLVATEDILVSTVRPNLNGVARVPDCLDKATASTGFCVLRPRTSRIDAGYLFHWVKTPTFVAEMVKQATGANYPAVSDKIIRQSRIPLPSLVEQRRIAAILDQADALRTKRRAALRQLDCMTESLFYELFGKQPQTPVTVGDKLDKHPNGWNWELLTRVARLATGHTPDRKRPDYWNGDIPWITLSDIRRLDGTIAQDSSERVTQAGIDNSSAVLLPPGTVCFSRTASLAFVTQIGRDMATSQDFVNWICGPALLPIFLMHALIRSRERLRALSTGSTHKTIYFPTVEQFRVLVPPIALQRVFATQVAEVDKLKAVQTASVDKLDALFASLQHRAFRGVL